MGDKADGTTPGALAGKLEAIRAALDALTPQELRALLEEPELLRETFGAARKASRAGVEDALEALGKTDIELDRRPRVNVQLTKKQAEEARRLRLEIWKKQGIEEEMLALAKIRGAREDPFAGRDREPVSPDEE